MGSQGMRNQAADLVKEACQEMVEKLSTKDNLSKEDFMNIKRTICAKYGLRFIPPNSAVLNLLPPEIRDQMRTILMIKPTRTASGIAVIAVMSKPHICPSQAKCVYCPGGVDSGSPKSYTGFEPAALRGVQNDFDSFREVEARLKQLEAVGHRVEKSEIIIMGGTFLNFPLDYQEEFVKGCFDALNGRVSSTIEEAHKLNETALRRNVGLTFETRPDLCGEAEVDLMLRYGATRVELGVQILNDDVYRIIRRGHKVKDVAEAFRTAKDSGLKVVAH
ncbi:MAG TPA: radical SAM protein, partial [Nitrososphaerales archaeon]